MSVARGSLSQYSCTWMRLSLVVGLGRRPASERPRLSRVTVEHLLHRFMRAATRRADRDRTRPGQAEVRSSATPQDGVPPVQGWPAPRPGPGIPRVTDGRPMSRVDAPSDSFLMGCPSKRHAPASLTVCSTTLDQPCSQPATTWLFITRYSSTWPNSAPTGHNSDHTDASSSSSRNCCGRSCTGYCSGVLLSKPPTNLSLCVDNMIYQPSVRPGLYASSKMG